MFRYSQLTSLACDFAVNRESWSEFAEAMAEYYREIEAVTTGRIFE